MNTLLVTKACTATSAGVAPQAFVPGDKIAPGTPFYWVMLWSGNAVDSGSEDATDALQVFAPTLVVVSEEDPHLAPGGVWIEDLGNGDWTMWFAQEG